MRRRAVTGVLLAAGRSRRMGRENKLLSSVGGRPLVAATLANLLASRLGRLVVVTGHQGARVRAALGGAPVRFVHNTRHASGMSESIRAGCAAVGRGADGVLICLGDMPGVSARSVDALIDAFDPGRGREICVPSYRGRRGNPVLWSRRFLPELMRLRGDAGARHLLERYRQRLVEVPVAEAGVLRDVDDPRDLACSRRGARGPGPRRRG